MTEYDIAFTGELPDLPHVAQYDFLEANTGVDDFVPSDDEGDFPDALQSPWVVGATILISTLLTAYIVTRPENRRDSRRPELNEVNETRGERRRRLRREQEELGD